MSADEQAREVEVVRGVLRDHGLEQGGGGLHDWRCGHPDRYGTCDCVDALVQALHAALEPIRAAERQEAAREGAAAMDAALADSRGAHRVAAEAADRFRDVLADALNYLDENPGDDVLVADLRERFGRTGPEPRRWRDFCTGAKAYLEREDFGWTDEPPIADGVTGRSET